jgi:hypothetical protein
MSLASFVYHFRICLAGICSTTCFTNYHDLWTTQAINWTLWITRPTIQYSCPLFMHSFTFKAWLQSSSECSKLPHLHAYSSPASMMSILYDTLHHFSLYSLSPHVLDSLWLCATLCYEMYHLLSSLRSKPIIVVHPHLVDRVFSFSGFLHNLYANQKSHTTWEKTTPLTVCYTHRAAADNFLHAFHMVDIQPAFLILNAKPRLPQIQVVEVICFLNRVKRCTNC